MNSVFDKEGHVKKVRAQSLQELESKESIEPILNESTENCCADRCEAADDNNVNDINSCKTIIPFENVNNPDNVESTSDTIILCENEINR